MENFPAKDALEKSVNRSWIVLDSFRKKTVGNPYTFKKSMEFMYNFSEVAKVRIWIQKLVSFYTFQTFVGT